MFDTGFIVVTMFAISMLMVWAFFKFSPEYADKKTVKSFNYGMLGVCFILCLALSFKAYIYLAGSKYEDFLPIFLFLINMMILAVTLMVGFLVRNFFIFK